MTGAARGQGEAEARKFVEEGAFVVMGDVLDEAGEAVAAELGDQPCISTTTCPRPRIGPGWWPPRWSRGRCGRW